MVLGGGESRVLDRHFSEEGGPEDRQEKELEKKDVVAQEGCRFSADSGPVSLLR